MPIATQFWLKTPCFEPLKVLTEIEKMVIADIPNRIFRNVAFVFSGASVLLLDKMRSAAKINVVTWVVNIKNRMSGRLVW